jgi:hypothetical protein
MIVRRLAISALGFAAAALFLYLMLPHIRATISRNAVITTWLHVAKTPIEGTVEDIRLTPGIVATADIAVARVANDQNYLGQATEIERQTAKLGEEIAADKDMLAALEERLTQRKALVDRYIAALHGDLAGALRIEEANLAGTQTQIVDQQRDLARLSSLRRGGNAADSAVQHAQAQLDNLVSLGHAQEELIARLHKRQDAVGDGVFLETSISDVPWAMRDVEEISLEILKTRSTLTQNQAALAYLNGIKDNVVMVLPAGMTLWDRLASSASFVRTGDGLFSYIDCRHLLVDVVVTDGVLGLLKIGDAARVHIIGAGGDIDGHIVLLRGSRALLAEGQLAATVADRAFREGQAIVELDPGSGDKVACPVGRTAYVEFRSLGIVTEFIQRLRH